MPAANLMTKDEERKIATDIARLPELVGRARDPENVKRVRQFDGPRRERGTAFSCRSPEAKHVSRLFEAMEGGT